MTAQTLMIQGTASHVGKSVLVTALCRLLHRKGVRVAPFKAVNMSNNAWVTADGKEMAVAQAVQAKAAGIEPCAEMNPILLKPTGENRSQLVLMGISRGEVSVDRFPLLRQELTQAIESAFEKLLGLYEWVIIEGAGSPAEVNLQERDLANMHVARMKQTPVVMVGDIERGGVFAHLTGTMDLLDPQDRELIKGFFINKFRGDPGLLEPGIDWLESRTGRPVLGVIPFFPEIRIPEEDSLAESVSRSGPRPPGRSSSDSSILIQIIRYPHLSNFTDFDPLLRESGVTVQYLTQPTNGSDRPDLLILPGSKSTVADLTWLRSVGLDRTVRECVEEKIPVVGICGGFQMLGEMIYDPSRVESQESAVPGLGLLPTRTLFLSTKVTTQVKGVHLESGTPVRGYEIHMGRLQGARRGKPVFHLTDRGGAPVGEPEGCRIPGKRIWGTYIHGLFDEDQFREYFLNHTSHANWAHSFCKSRVNQFRAHPPVRGRASEDPYDRLVDALRPHLRMDKIAREIPCLPPL